MDKIITVSAPGKLMLFGEHAVVQGKPCIVTAVNQRIKLKIKKIDEPILELEAKDVGVIGYKKSLKDLGIGEISKGAKFVEIAVKNFLTKYKILGGVKIQTVSQFKSVFGFGSSSASAICTVKALSEIYNLKLSQKQIFDLAYKTVLDIQGVGSGFDLAAAIFGGTLYFETGGKTIKSLNVENLPLIVGYTDVKADTATLVKQVNARAKKYPIIYKNIFDNIEIIVNDAKKALLKNDLEKLGELMDLNQGFLESLGVGSDKLSALIYAARGAGAYGAKLSGAGGGDCMIALAPPSKKRAVEKAIEKAGGLVLKVQVNSEGVKIEKENK